MYDDIISRIDPDKRSRIINASIEEFAEYSYEKASTNNIVKKAGISKGLLFHYFGSKKDLYDTMVVFVIHTLYDEIVTKINWDEPDLFERIKQLAVIKLAYSQMYPHMFDFMLQTLTYKKAGNTEKILDLYKDYGLDLMQLSKDIYVKNIDYSKFSDPSTVAESAKIVSWTLEKFSEETLAALRTDGKLDLGKAVDGMNRYMAILKKAFYK